MTTTLDIMNALKSVMDPEIHRNVVELNMVRNLALTIPACPLRDQISEDARRTVGALPVSRAWKSRSAR